MKEILDNLVRSLLIDGKNAPHWQYAKQHPERA